MKHYKRIAMYVAALAFIVMLYGILPHIWCLIPPGYLFSLPAEFEDDLSKGVISDELQSIFQADDRYLSENATLERVDGEWRIVDKGGKYLIRRDDRRLSVYSSPGISDIFHPYLSPLRSYATRYGFDPDAAVVTTLLTVGLITTLAFCFLMMREFEGATAELTRDVKKRLR